MKRHRTRQRLIETARPIFEWGVLDPDTGRITGWRFTTKQRALYFVSQTCGRCKPKHIVRLRVEVWA